jgi:hypothetical protein
MKELGLTVSAARVLSSEADDELADLAADRRPAGPIGVCLAASNETPVPAQQRARGHKNEPQRERGSSWLAAASKIRSLGSSRGRPAWLMPQDNDFQLFEAL